MLGVRRRDNGSPACAYGKVSWSVYYKVSCGATAVAARGFSLDQMEPPKEFTSNTSVLTRPESPKTRLTKSGLINLDEHKLISTWTN